MNIFAELKMHCCLSFVGSFVNSWGEAAIDFNSVIMIKHCWPLFYVTKKLINYRLKIVAIMSTIFRG